MRLDVIGREGQTGRALAIFSAALLVALAAAGPAAAQTPKAGGGTSRPAGRTVEGVAAVVGSQTILKSELEDQVRLAAEQLQVDLSDSSSANKLRRDVLGRMVDDQVLLLEAEAQNIKVGEDEIKQSVDDEVQNNIRQMGKDGFAAELKKEGLTEVELRARYAQEARKQMLAQRLITKDVRPKVELPDSIATRKFFEENRSQLPKKPRQLRIQDLFVATRPDSVIDQRAQQRAEEVRAKIRGGMSFTDAAKTYSDDPRAKESPSLGRITRGQLPIKELEQAAFTLKVGEVSAPVKSRLGYHLLKVDDKDPAGQWVELSHILLAVNSTRADEVAAQEKAQKIFSEIQGGKIDFTEAVHRYSDDPDSKQRDGDLGWIPIDNVYGDMKAVADTLRVGRLGGPAAGDGGYHIFRIQGEQLEGPYAFDEIQDQLKQLAAQKQLEKELRTYLDGLRKKYFVEIRTD